MKDTVYLNRSANEDQCAGSNVNPAHRSDQIYAGSRLWSSLEGPIPMKHALTGEDLNNGSVLYQLIKQRMMIDAKLLDPRIDDRRFRVRASLWIDYYNSFFFSELQYSSYNGKMKGLLRLPLAPEEKEAHRVQAIDDSASDLAYGIIHAIQKFFKISYYQIST